MPPLSLRRKVIFGGVLFRRSPKPSSSCSRTCLCCSGFRTSSTMNIRLQVRATTRTQHTLHCNHNLLNTYQCYSSSQNHFSFSFSEVWAQSLQYKFLCSIWILFSHLHVMYCNPETSGVEYGLMSHLTHYRSFCRWFSRPIAWEVPSSWYDLQRSDKVIDHIWFPFGIL